MQPAAVQPPTPRHHVRFTLPHPVSALSDQEQQTRVEHLWRGDDILLVDGLGHFVRCLVQARCSQQHEVVFSLWAAVDEDDAQRAIDCWWSPGYASLTMPGRLANSLPHWDLLDAPVLLAVRDAQQHPFVDGSTDPRVADILRERWPHTGLALADEVTAPRVRSGPA